MTTARRVAGTPTGPRVRRRPRLPPRGPRRRMAMAMAFYLVLLAVIAGRIVQVQVVDADTYASLAVQQRTNVRELPATRGRIYDRNGTVLATSVDAATIGADPRAFRSVQLPDGRVQHPPMTAAEAAAILAPIIGTDADTIERRLSSEAHFVYLARQLDWEVGAEALASGVPGLERRVEPRRVYPAGDLVAQLVGFTNFEGAGAEGLEWRHDEMLAGVPGTQAVEEAPRGLVIANGQRVVTPAEPGTDLVMTIDSEIQSVTQQAAMDAMERHDAVGVSVVVMDVATGDVLAMVSVPGFDPDYLDGDPAHLRSRAVTAVYEPGSVQKAITVAAALEEGLITPTTTFTIADNLTVGGKTFRDSTPHPTEEMSIGTIMETSSNVGSIRIAQLLGEQRLHDWLERFGFRQTTGIGLPGESVGSFPQMDQWWATSLPTIAMGHGVSASLLRMATAYATLGNDGVAVTPRILRGTVGEDGTLDPAPVPVGERIVSPATAGAVRDLLQAAVHGDRATGGAAIVEGYDVAGKTGTAMKVRDDGRGYTDQYIASFVGMAPVDQPELVVAVMVDEPQNGGHYGGVAAAPVFQEVMAFALRARHVAPTEPGPTLDEAFEQAMREITTDTDDDPPPTTE